MSVFLFKALTLMVKTLARPIINWLSYYNRLKIQESDKKSLIFFRTRLISLGQNFHYYNTKFNSDYVSVNLSASELLFKIIIII